MRTIVQIYIQQDKHLIGRLTLYIYIYIYKSVNTKINTLLSSW